MNFVNKAVDAVFKCAVILAQILLVAMVVIVFANVVLRYVFNSGLRWSEEIVLVIVIWFSFIAMSLGVKEDLHININVLPKKTPKNIIVVLYAFKQILQTALASVMFYYGIKLTLNGAKSFLPATGIPNSINYLVVPIAGFFIFMFSVRALFLIRKNMELVLLGEKINV